MRINLTSQIPNPFHRVAIMATSLGEAWAMQSVLPSWAVHQELLAVVFQTPPIVDPETVYASLLLHPQVRTDAEDKWIKQYCMLSTFRYVDV